MADSHDLSFWLATTFQNRIEVGLQLSASPAPEETPYIHKYQAITTLKTLLERSHPYHFIVHTILGGIYSDVEQLSDSLSSYEQALAGVAELKAEEVPKFGNTLIVLYNMLGFSYINREHIAEGVGCLAKAMEIYECTLGQQGPDVYNSRAEEPRGRHFRCYYEGGVSREELEDSHTLTLFYLAQSYTKLGLKHKAAENCGLTLKRQHATGRFELNDFCHNLMGLAEYYEGECYFGQALYLLVVAMEVLPEGRKKKMRAKVEIALGVLFGRVLENSVEGIRGGRTPKALEELNRQGTREFLSFENFKQSFPEVKVVSTL
jgi:tetratricopeptide (TPR) repeat protein